jgi:hypothetical protein
LVYLASEVIPQPRARLGHVVELVYWVGIGHGHAVKPAIVFVPLDRPGILSR